MYSEAQNAENTPSPRNVSLPIHKIEDTSIVELGIHEPPTYELATGGTAFTYANDIPGYVTIT